MRTHRDMLPRRLLTTSAYTSTTPLRELLLEKRFVDYGVSVGYRSTIGADGGRKSL